MGSVVVVVFVFEGIGVNIVGNLETEGFSRFQHVHTNKVRRYLGT